MIKINSKRIIGLLVTSLFSISSFAFHQIPRIKVRIDTTAIPIIEKITLYDSIDKIKKTEIINTQNSCISIESESYELIVTIVVNTSPKPIIKHLSIEKYGKSVELKIQNGSFIFQSYKESLFYNRLLFFLLTILIIFSTKLFPSMILTPVENKREFIKALFGINIVLILVMSLLGFLSISFMFILYPIYLIISSVFDFIVIRAARRDDSFSKTLLTVLISFGCFFIIGQTALILLMSLIEIR